GISISPAPSKVIEESRISVIVFLRNCASSTWCLDELVKIVEWKNTSLVRKHIGSFQEAIVNHEEVLKGEYRKGAKMERRFAR
ncbi:hypothetical protein CISIN_1g0383901mg, partial [Citrus sinensis]